MWVHSRQFTGRIVTVTNDKVFDEPVYNYTHEFPYIWDEMRLPIRYQDDRAAAEQILLEAARRHARHLRQVGETRWSGSSSASASRSARSIRRSSGGSPTTGSKSRCVSSLPTTASAGSRTR